jgi:peptide/nickel transport system permease protein
MRFGTGVALVVVLVLLAVLAPLLAPYGPNVLLDPAALRSAAPSMAHPLGTDPYSRDVLSRVLFGARVSLGIAAIAMLLAITVGLAVGMTSGWAGGLTDTVLMRAVDIALAVPRLFVVLVVLALWEHVALLTLALILGGTGWFGICRLVRAEVHTARALPYVAAARTSGASTLRILTRHVLPNIAGPLIVAAAMGMGQVVLLEAGLSYLGIGVPQPTASWGSIVADGQNVLGSAPWISGGAGIAIVITVLAFTLLGDGIRERLDPRHA